jgi:hypothetical protein
MVPENFSQQILDATKQVLLALLKIILLPFNLWVKAIGNLAEQKERGTLDLNKITGLWPFFTFCKRLFLDVILDVIAFLAYPIGAIVALFSFVYTFIGDYADMMSLGNLITYALANFILILFIVYVIPVVTVILNNYIQLCFLLPLRKLIDWLQKPAQHLNVDSVQSVKVKKEEE